MHTHTEQEGIRVAIFLKKFFSNFLRKQAHARHFLWNFNLCVHISAGIPAKPVARLAFDFTG